MAIGPSSFQVYNCTQRAHQNTLEQSSFVSLCSSRLAHTGVSTRKVTADAQIIGMTLFFGMLDSSVCDLQD